MGRVQGVNNYDETMDLQHTEIAFVFLQFTMCSQLTGIPLSFGVIGSLIAWLPEIASTS